MLSLSTRILENSVDVLGLALQTLEEATLDVPRLKRVLDTEKVFAVVPKSDVDDAKWRLKKRTHPQISFLVEKLEKEVSRLERKQAALQSDHQLRQLRLESSGDRVENSDNETKRQTLKLLRAKRERLAYTLSRRRLMSYLPPPGS